MEPKAKPKPSIEKDRYEIALDQIIKEQVGTRIKDEDPNKTNLDTPQIRRAKLEIEIRDSLDLDKFGAYLDSAIKIFRGEGEQYLAQESETLVSELDRIQKQLKTLDLTILKDENLNKSLNVSDQFKSLALQIGINKFKEGLFQDSLSVFVFLAGLESDNPDYWYRAGLAAQECEHFDFALTAYAETSNLAPDFIGSRVFKAQVHLDLNEHDKALAELDEIKIRMGKNNGDDENWKRYVIDLEYFLTHTSGDE